MSNNTLVRHMSAPPIWSQVSNKQGVASIDYERFFNATQSNISVLINNAQPYLTVNPDFNVLSANGYNAVTNSSANLTAIVSNWMIDNGTGNVFNIMPVAYTDSQRPISGSNNYINAQVTTLNTPITLINQNYSTTGQFRGDTYTGQTLTFSTVINNNNVSQSHAPELQFQAYLSNIGTIAGNTFYLQPNLNYIRTTLQIPQFNTQDFGSNPYTQFQVAINAANNENLNFDIYYFKTELSDSATPLVVNHILEQLVCQNLV
jgi:hypothetical protein